MKAGLILFCFLIGLNIHVYPQEKYLQAKLNINTESEIQAYSSMIFGQFIEHFHRQIYGGIYEPGSPLSDEAGFRMDVTEALKELKVPVVRWPGGCFVSSYHWLNGVGEKRIPVYDKTWQVEEPNTFGTDEFVEWCRKIGAEPYICTNAGTGTPEEMSDWVEYCNLESMGKFAAMRIANGHSKPHNVKFWSIGNENYGSWELGAKTVDEWGYFVRESAKLMLNVDTSIQLFAAALPDTAWTIPLLERSGKYLNYISIHGYWDRLQEVNNPSDYLTCMGFSVFPEKRIQSTIEILKRTGYDEQISIAFDEWNLRSWHHPGHGDHREKQDIEARDLADINSTYTMADALFSASFLNSCLRNSKYVKMACMAPIVNTRGPLYVYPEGIIKRTTFHLLKMYADLLLPYVLKSELNSDSMEVILNGRKMSIPLVDAIVTCNEDKHTYSIALVNRHPDNNTLCRIESVNLPKKIEAIVLSGDSPDAYNDIDRPERVMPQKMNFNVKNGSILLPPHSVVVFQLSL
jgi:alpha-L-arabinofuranosidase